MTKDFQTKKKCVLVMIEFSFMACLQKSIPKPF